MTVNTPGILRPNEFKKFLVEWRCGRVTVRDLTEADVLFLDWVDPTPFPITHFGVRTGWGATGTWRIKHFRTGSAQIR